MIKRKLPKVKCLLIGKVTEKGFTDVKLTLQLHSLSFLSILSLYLFAQLFFIYHNHLFEAPIYILVALGTLPREYFMTTYV
jgi:hypothetical protein